MVVAAGAVTSSGESMTLANTSATLAAPIITGSRHRRTASQPPILSIRSKMWYLSSSYPPNLAPPCR